MNTSLEQPKICLLLQERAQMLAKARSFFHERNILEVDCPSLQANAQIDANIDVISVELSQTKKAYLHTSPEYTMKQLLSQGSSDIYFLGHVYRKEEMGRLHKIEFTMAEWYRLSFTLDDMIDETVEFLSLFLPNLTICKISYREAFEKYAKINYTEDDLSHLLPENGMNWSRQESLHYILAKYIEPHLGQNTLSVITNYPPYEAALARTELHNGEEVAKRFEIYYQGVELANGYHELTNATVLRKRFEKENEARKMRGQRPLEIDERFLASIKDLPDCCGVSIGFDRAFMLQQNFFSISDCTI